MTPRPPTPQQRRAAAPFHSVWVTANAGTGKTRVLADRVLRLLLEGADPESILGITFTKAAAAEMIGRIEERLATWATTGADEALRAEITELTGTEPSPQRVHHARRLFARVLELPRGLPIMTIHALCGALLRRFPLEAGVVPHFETIDERKAAELMHEARAEVLTRASADGTGPLGRALSRLAVTLAETTLGEALGEVLAQRTRLLRARDALGGLDELIAAIARVLDAKPGVSPHRLVQRACADGEYDAEGLRLLADTFRRGGKKQLDAAEKIAVWLAAAPEDRVRQFERYHSAFLTQKDEPRADIVTDKFRRERPAEAATYAREQARLVRLDDALKAARLAERTEALLRVGLAVIEAYQDKKAREAALDYDDLIERTRRLLAQPGKTEWVLYKIDRRIDHVLVDEAQDTSPTQWEIVETLTAEFFAGLGARHRRRTLFVVGDEKQSIYRFQGADLANFRAVHRRLAGRVRAADLPFAEEVLDRSFRSTRAVLELVDRVFALPEARAGVVEPGTVVRHDTERRNDPGLVELWPLCPPVVEDRAVEPWPLPDQPRFLDEPERRVADAVARTIHGWIASHERLASTGRPIRPGDILILVSRRGRVQELLIRALKRHGVPVAGADRLALGEHIAVKDLIALGRVMLLPEDDLQLACVLKSPLLGLDEDALMALAWDRGPASLMERLRAAAGTEPDRYGEAYERLAGWLRRADFMPPFELFTWILGADGGRKRLLARLGPDALEPIEAFLGQALAYERGHPASLEGFVAWLCTGSQELKRDPEKARDVVRVTTVHGAKGLEAPIVILADAGPHGPAQRGRLLWGDPDGLGLTLPFWRAAKPEREGITARLAEEEETLEADERRRLLYVALTRARDRLYVTGWLPKRDGKESNGANGEPCWHELVRRALAGVESVERHEVDFGRGFAGELLRVRRGVAVAPTEPPPATPPPARPAMPAWALHPAPPEPLTGRPLAPSRLSDDEPPPTSPRGPEGAERFRVGVLVHRLLQLVPDLPPERRAATVARFLAQAAPDLPAETRERLGRRVMAVMAEPDLAPVFAAGARAEQALAGVVDGVAIAGQVDRMAVTDDRVIVVDFKTHRLPPRTAAATPRAYLRQMAAYRALLQRIYPGRAVEAALVWTESLTVTWLPATLLDTHAPAADRGSRTAAFGAAVHDGALTVPGGQP